MNWAHVHLIINHVPVIGVPGAILLLCYGIIRKSQEVKMLSLGFFVLIALITLAVFFSGQSAADFIKELHLQGVTEAFIGRHEEIADLAVVFMELLGLLSLTGLFLLHRKGAIPAWTVVSVLILSILTAGVVGFTANLGGQIRHTEIRSDGITNAP
jgi:hypothetical protein